MLYKSFNPIALLCWITFLFPTFLVAEEIAVGNYVIVTAESLNLRSNPSSKSIIITKLKQNDTLEVIGKEGNWLSVRVKEYQGFVYSKYVKLNKKMGFYDWFKEGFGMGGVIIFVLIFGAKVMSLREKDARFSSGYRQGVVGGGGLVLSFIISAVSGLFIGAGYAIYMLIRSWFN
jgi:hypothetical protein